MLLLHPCHLNYNLFHSVAGHETTSSALAFTLWALAQNTDIQRKLREEVRTIAGEPTYDDFVDPNLLPYLDAVCKEAMRMFPPAARNEKAVQEDDVIPLRQPICKFYLVLSRSSCFLRSHKILRCPI